MKWHILVIAVLLAAVATPTTAAPLIMKKGDPSYVRGIRECSKLANARGWVRPGERGRFKFILDCRRGKVI
jgi:hypothetical protein